MRPSRDHESSTPTLYPHLQRRLAAAGKACRWLLPALPCPGCMRARAMLYRVNVAPELLYALSESSALPARANRPAAGYP
eukprot:352834-Chlamydomonas_euryale.AAC.16